MKGKKDRQTRHRGPRCRKIPLKQYWQVFGLGPWVLADMQATGIVLHDRVLDHTPLSVRSGIANIGDLQIELLQPLSGQSSYAEFFGKYGNGIHHISFGGVEDADEMLATMQKQGYGIEMQGILGGDTQFTYMATQKKLGAIYGLAKKIPGTNEHSCPAMVRFLLPNDAQSG